MGEYFGWASAGVGPRKLFFDANVESALGNKSGLFFNDGTDDCASGSRVLADLMLLMSISEERLVA